MAEEKKSRKNERVGGAIYGVLLGTGLAILDNITVRYGLDDLKYNTLILAGSGALGGALIPAAARTITRGAYNASRFSVSAIGRIMEYAVQKIERLYDKKAEKEKPGEVRKDLEGKVEKETDNMFNEHPETKPKK